MLQGMAAGRPWIDRRRTSVDPSGRRSLSFAQTVAVVCTCYSADAHLIFVSYGGVWRKQRIGRGDAVKKQI